ncbi:MAG: TolC family protein [Leptolyngbyaceae cyanobacterium]
MLLVVPIAQATPVFPSDEDPLFGPLPTPTETPGSEGDGLDGEEEVPETESEIEGERDVFETQPEEEILDVDRETTESERLPETDRSQLALSLPELIELVVIGNRDLRDQQLQRLIEQQELQEAEEQFDPRWTPAVGVGITQRFDEGFATQAPLPGAIGGDTTELGDRTTLTQSAGLLGEINTRQGTEFNLTLDTLGDTPISLQVTQPLLRGAGTAVNEAPVDIARLTEAQNWLELQDTLIDTVSTTVIQYTTLIEAQESVVIQTQALERRRERLQILTALVEAGRNARVDLVDAERSIADAERDLLLAQTQLEEANTALLDQIGTEQAVLFIASADTIADLFTAAAVRVETFEVEALAAIAYQRRPDYLQAELDPDVAQLNLRVAENDLQWQLNVESTADLGDFSETTLGLVLRRTFDEPELETALTRSQVEVAQAENRLAQLQTTIRNEVINQLNTVRANLARVDAARRATENARLQLEVTQELFNRGRSGADIFRIITQEEDLVQAQSQQLTAEIEFLNSIVNLDQAVGLTLDTWSQEVDFLPALLTPRSLDAFETNAPILGE